MFGCACTIRIASVVSNSVTNSRAVITYSVIGCCAVIGVITVCCYCHLDFVHLFAHQDQVYIRLTSELIVTSQFELCKLCDFNRLWAHTPLVLRVLSRRAATSVCVSSPRLTRLSVWYKERLCFCLRIQKVVAPRLVDVRLQYLLNLAAGAAPAGLRSSGYCSDCCRCLRLQLGGYKPAFTVSVTTLLLK